MMGKWFSFEIIRNLTRTAVLGFLFFGVSFAVGFALSRTMLLDSRASAANLILDKPTYN